MQKDFKMYYDNEIMLGFTQNDIERLKQWIYNCLMTERYDYEIFTHNFGVSLKNLLGGETERGLLTQQIADNIRDGLTYDDRINDVTDFDISFDDLAGTITAKFNVQSIYGEISISAEVNANASNITINQ
jgi:hypothetical protein